MFHRIARPLSSGIKYDQLPCLPRPTKPPTTRRRTDDFRLGWASRPQCSLLAAMVCCAGSPFDVAVGPGPRGRGGFLDGNVSPRARLGGGRGGMGGRADRAASVRFDMTPAAKTVHDIEVYLDAADLDGACTAVGVICRRLLTWRAAGVSVRPEQLADELCRVLAAEERPDSRVVAALAAY